MAKEKEKEEQIAYGRIKGTAWDAGAGMPIPYSRVDLVLYGEKKPIDITATDIEGKFNFPHALPHLEPGRYNVILYSIVYEPVRQEVVVKAGKEIEIELRTSKVVLQI